MSEDSELHALSRLSAALGRDPCLVQAATGNTSIKIGSQLWIKASGAWLAHADRKDIFVAVDSGEVRACVARQIPYSPEFKDRSGVIVQPSVETPMHALLPHRVVIHVHSVNAIARAVRSDGAAHVASRLAGLSWEWIPYISSGLPLALQIQSVMSSAPDVLILANHGLVVGGDSCHAAAALLGDVEDRLRIAPRCGSEPDLTQLQRLAANELCWRLPDNPAVHTLGTDTASRAILLGGTLYPCQAVSLDANTAMISPQTRISDCEDLHRARYGTAPKFLVVEGTGVLIKKSMTSTESEILLGLAHVVQRIDPGAPIRYLSPADLDELSAGDVHHYQYVGDRFEDSRNRSQLRNAPLHSSSK